MDYKKVRSATQVINTVTTISNVKRGVLNACQLCSKKFGTFLKEHQCKRCVRAVCDDCSKHKSKIVGYEIKPTASHRICKVCKEEQDFQNEFRTKNSLAFATDSEIGTKWWDSLGCDSSAGLKTVESPQLALSEVQGIDQINIMKVRKDLNYSMLEFAYYVCLKEKDERINELLHQVIGELCCKMGWMSIPSRIDQLCLIVLCFTKETKAVAIIEAMFKQVMPVFVREYLASETEDLETVNWTQSRTALSFQCKQIFGFSEVDSKAVNAFILNESRQMIATLFVYDLNFPCFIGIFQAAVAKTSFMEIEKSFIAIVAANLNLIKDQKQDVHLGILRNTRIADIKKITGDFEQKYVQAKRSAQRSMSMQGLQQSDSSNMDSDTDLTRSSSQQALQLENERIHAALAAQEAKFREEIVRVQELFDQERKVWEKDRSNHDSENKVVSGLKAEIEQRDEEIKRLLNQNLHAELKHSDELKDGEQHMVKLQELEQREVTLTASVESLKQTLNEKSQLAEQHELTISQLKQEAEASLSAKNELQAENNKLKEQQSSASEVQGESQSSKQGEIDELKQKLVELESAKKAEADEYEAKLVAMEKSLKESVLKHSEIDSNQSAEVEQLKKKITDVEAAKKAEVDELSIKLAALQKDLKESAMKLSELEVSHCDELNNSKQLLEGITAELAKAKEEHALVLLSQQNDIASSNKKLEESTAVLLKLKDQLHHEKESHHQEIHAAKKKNEELETQLSKVKVEQQKSGESHHSQFDEQKKRIAELEVELAKIKGEQESLHSEHGIAGKRVLELQAELLKSKTEHEFAVERHSRELTSSKTRVQEVEAEVLKVKGDYVKSEEVHRAESSAQLQKAEALQVELRRVQQEHEQAQVKHHAEIEKVSLRVEQVQLELVNSKSAHGQSDEKHRVELLGSQQAVAQIQAELAKSQSEHKHAVEQHQQEIVGSNKKADDALAELSKLKAEHEAVIKKIEVAEKKVEQLQVELQKSVVDGQTAEKKLLEQMEVKDRNVGDLKAQVSLLEVKALEVQQESAKQQQVVLEQKKVKREQKKLVQEKELKEQQHQKHEHEKQIKQLREQLVEKEQQLQHSVSEVIELKAMVSKIEGESGHSQTEIVALKAMIGKIEAERESLKQSSLSEIASVQLTVSALKEKHEEHLKEKSEQMSSKHEAHLKEQLEQMSSKHEAHLKEQLEQMSSKYEVRLKEQSEQMSSKHEALLKEQSEQMSTKHEAHIKEQSEQMKSKHLAELDGVKSQNNDLIQKVTQLSADIARITDELAKSNSDIAGKSNEILRLSAVQVDIQSHFDEHKKSHELLKEKHAKEVLAFNEMIESQKSKSQEVLAINAVIGVEKAQQQKEIAELAASVSLLKIAVEKSKHDLHEATQQRDKEKEHAHQEKYAHQQEKEKMLKEIVQLKEDLKEISQKDASVSAVLQREQERQVEENVRLVAEIGQVKSAFEAERAEMQLQLKKESDKVSGLEIQLLTEAENWKNKHEADVKQAKLDEKAVQIAFTEEKVKKVTEELLAKFAVDQARAVSAEEQRVVALEQKKSHELETEFKAEKKSLEEAFVLEKEKIVKEVELKCAQTFDQEKHTMEDAFNHDKEHHVKEMQVQCEQKFEITKQELLNQFKVEKEATVKALKEELAAEKQREVDTVKQVLADAFKVEKTALIEEFKRHNDKSLLDQKILLDLDFQRERVELLSAAEKEKVEEIQLARQADLKTFQTERSKLVQSNEDEKLIAQQQFNQEKEEEIALVVRSKEDTFYAEKSELLKQFQEDLEKQIQVTRMTVQGECQKSNADAIDKINTEKIQEIAVLKATLEGAFAIERTTINQSNQSSLNALKEESDKIYLDKEQKLVSELEAQQHKLKESLELISQLETKCSELAVAKSIVDAEISSVKSNLAEGAQTTENYMNSLNDSLKNVEGKLSEKNTAIEQLSNQINSLTEEKKQLQIESKSKSNERVSSVQYEEIIGKLSASKLLAKANTETQIEWEELQSTQDVHTLIHFILKLTEYSNEECPQSPEYVYKQANNNGEEVAMVNSFTSELNNASTSSQFRAGAQSQSAKDLLNLVSTAAGASGVHQMSVSVPSSPRMMTSGNGNGSLQMSNEVKQHMQIRLLESKITTMKENISALKEVDKINSELQKLLREKEAKLKDAKKTMKHQEVDLADKLSDIKGCTEQIADLTRYMKESKDFEQCLLGFEDVDLMHFENVEAKIHQLRERYAKKSELINVVEKMALAFREELEFRKNDLHVYLGKIQLLQEQCQALMEENEEIIQLLIENQIDASRFNSVSIQQQQQRSSLTSSTVIRKSSKPSQEINFNDASHQTRLIQARRNNAKEQGEVKRAQQMNCTNSDCSIF